jgi:hypothetical protein
MPRATTSTLKTLRNILVASGRSLASVTASLVTLQTQYPRTGTSGCDELHSLLLNLTLSSRSLKAPTRVICRLWHQANHASLDERRELTKICMQSSAWNKTSEHHAIARRSNVCGSFYRHAFRCLWSRQDVCVIENLMSVATMSPKVIFE